ncbi:hypothetical protein NDU88_010265 [Pleurodeles waltl]|uniref:Uncharacterized protein n=1 Tax=Pleurodeles waltl TaxID=8319 RepID=A0AAV7PY73_PLEWA|nr:hypothetical protein NDU88_010265 [Pleurodeles waltl]
MSERAEPDAALLPRPSLVEPAGPAPRSPPEGSIPIHTRPEEVPLGRRTSGEREDPWRGGSPVRRKTTSGRGPW